MGRGGGGEESRMPKRSRPSRFLGFSSFLGCLSSLRESFFLTHKCEGGGVRES